MRKAQAGLVALVVGIAAVTLSAEAQVASKKPAADLKAGIARDTKLKEATVEKVLKALAPAMKEQLTAGRQIELPGVGTLRVVRVGETKDLVNGRPALLPARNYIEYIPAEDMNDAANAPGAVPAREVKGYEFRVNPDSNPGQRTDGVRTPNRRTR